MLVAVGGMLSAQFRLTYSLTVIMLETTNSINIFAPMMLCALTATKVANIISPGFYQVAIKQKSIQILPKEPPRASMILEARNIMNSCEICAVHAIC